MSGQASTILGTGFFVPEKIVTNKDLEQIMDTSDEWIVSRTGIRERRIATKEQPASYLGFRAAEMAIEDAGIDKSAIDMIITATITGDYVWPATACVIQDRLGLPGIPAFDISVACSGFVYGLSIAKSMIAAGTASNVLVVCTEKFSSNLNWQDRNVSVLFADGAGAVVVGKGTYESILATSLGAEGSKAELLLQPGGGSTNPITRELVDTGGHYMRMNGKEVFLNAVARMPEALDEALRKAGLGMDDLDKLVFHQANKRIIETMIQRYKLPEEKVVVNLDRYGNTSAATIPIALAESLRNGTIKKGDTIGVAAFGSGFTWGAAVIRV